MTSLSMLPQRLLLFILVIIKAQSGYGEEFVQEAYSSRYVACILNTTTDDLAESIEKEFEDICTSMLKESHEVYFALFEFGRRARVQRARWSNDPKDCESPRRSEDKFQDNNALEAAVPAALAKFPTIERAVLDAKAIMTKTIKPEINRKLLFITSGFGARPVYERVRSTVASLKENGVQVVVAKAPDKENPAIEEMQAIASRGRVVLSNRAEMVVNQLKNQPPKKSPPTKILPLPCKSESTSCPPYTEQTCGQTYPCPAPCPPCPNPPCPPCPAQPKPCPCLKPPCPCPCPGQPCIPPKPVKCPKAPYTKVGCFDLPKAMRRNIIWITPGVAPKNMPSWKKYLSILVCQCSKAAKRRGFSYFGVKYFKPGKHSVFYRGACLTAPNSRVNRFTQLFKSDSQACLDSSKGVCNIQDKNDCIGNTKKSVFCYKRTDDTEESEDDSEDSDGVDVAQDGTDGDVSHTTDDNGEKDDDSDDTEDATDAKLVK